MIPPLYLYRTSTCSSCSRTVSIHYLIADVCTRMDDIPLYCSIPAELATLFEIWSDQLRVGIKLALIGSTGLIPLACGLLL